MFPTADKIILDYQKRTSSKVTIYIRVSHLISKLLMYGKQLTVELRDIGKGRRCVPTITSPN